MIPVATLGCVAGCGSMGLKRRTYTRYGMRGLGVVDPCYGETGYAAWMEITTGPGQKCYYYCPMGGAATLTELSECSGNATVVPALPGAVARAPTGAAGAAEQIIPGLPNEYLYLGLAAVGGMVLLMSTR